MREKPNSGHKLETRRADLTEPAAPSAPPVADIQEFCGAIAPEEAAQMIREIEEAFEQTDGA